MQTMHPVIVSGRHVLDTSLFPSDEFEERVRQAREMMDACSLDGLVVHGNGEHSAALTYLTNLAPRMRWALAFVPRHGEIELVVAGPERDLHFSRAATWVRSVTPYDQLGLVAGAWVDALRVASGRARPRLGLAGGKHVRQRVLDDVERCLGQEADVWFDADAALDQRMECLRPREMRVMKGNLARLAVAVTATRQVVSGGGKAADAVRAAEKAGLLDGAHEVRTLFSRDGGLTLQPFERVESEYRPEFSGYVARRELGYWVEALVSHNVAPMQARSVVDVLSRMVDAARDGALVADIERLGESLVSGVQRHPFTVRAVAQLGLALHEKMPGEKLRTGGIYSLRAGLIFPDGTAAIGSVTVLVRGASAEILLGSYPTPLSQFNTR